MRVEYSKTFLKQFAKLSPSIQNAFFDRLELWSKDPASPQVRLHLLQGKYSGYWSINITGDVRALYRQSNPRLATFVLIGTHSQLYGK